MNKKKKTTELNIRVGFFNEILTHHSCCGYFISNEVKNFVDTTIRLQRVRLPLTVFNTDTIFDLDFRISRFFWIGWFGPKNVSDPATALSFIKYFVDISRILCLPLVFVGSILLWKNIGIQFQISHQKIYCFFDVALCYVTELLMLCISLNAIESIVKNLFTFKKNISDDYLESMNDPRGFWYFKI